MTILSLLAALALCGSVFLVGAAFVERPASALALRPRSAMLPRPNRDEAAAENANPGVLRPRDRGLVALLPFALGERATRRLAEAGSPASPGRFLLFCLVSGLVLPTAVVSLSRPWEADMTGLMMAIGTLVLGPAAPYVWLSGRVKRRRSAILKNLPDAFDLLTTCVEAGLGLDAALSRVATRARGPFGEELSRTLRELGMGRPRREALRGLADRTQIQDLELFVNAVIQVEQMGSSIGQLLRVQSEQMRRRRRQRAEQQAHRAPVKMMLPLVTMIFPSLFVVILGPAALQFVSSFPG
ncbi:MAG: type II secretion system F family protein [Dehalococcoidia bacterium]|nr:MAG: type II secretion system F family protein [Dehalococcoidia bacterium]